LKILVAEDEPELLRFYKVLLEDLGYDVVTAKDGQECLDLFRAGSDVGSGFDLVILDHRMPKKSGMDVANEIAATVPSQKLLMITAYAGLLDLKEKPENMKIMSKPFDVDELVSMIKELSK
jgi:two-component system cell cycle response regulator CpdR